MEMYLLYSLGHNSIKERTSPSLKALFCLLRPLEINLSPFPSPFFSSPSTLLLAEDPRPRTIQSQGYQVHCFHRSQGLWCISLQGSLIL